MLTEIGMTLAEWGDTDVVHQRFYRAAHGEKVDRQKKEQQKAG